jgi:ATP-dependent Clp protease ATP-binding subunit ClpA
LAKTGYDPVYGARPLARVIQREVRDPLTDEILFGKLEHGGTVTIGLVDNKLSFGFSGSRVLGSSGSGSSGSASAEPENLST